MAKTKKAYHHGDLKQALLREAERIVDQEGVGALTLREAARRVGVSHTAPQNHFGDLTGLLSELAAQGHAQLRARMTRDFEGVADPRDRLRAMGRAYVTFAKDHPGLFQLMSQSDRLDLSRPALREAITATRDALRNAVSAAPSQMTPAQDVARATAAWALVHGYASLMREGRLKALLAAAGETDPLRFFDTMMDLARFDGT